MIRSALAVAHPNIALAKYWGKKDGALNVPAVPSLSVTLDGMTTRTRVTFDPDFTRDALRINGTPAPDLALRRAVALLDRVRAASRVTDFASIESENDFPTASGLASSASGFAALALAGTHAADLAWSEERVADLARQSSASAARSIFGGFAELVGERARQVAPKEALAIRVLVAVVTEEVKPISSSQGMAITAEKSPFYDAWLAYAPLAFEKIRAALLEGDFDAVGDLAEANALAMHASAIAAGVVYFRPITLDVLACVRGLRVRSVGAYATMDAGPHVKVLARDRDADVVAHALSSVPGVARVIETKPGDGARIVELAEPTSSQEPDTIRMDEVTP